LWRDKAIDLVQELADVLEIIEALSAANKIPFEEVKTMQIKKKADTWGF
jgi:predicted house-cleaning noncanonical NTP pyrophosphatase (MazG superfamily)